MDSSNTEEGLDGTLVVRRDNLYPKKNRINKLSMTICCGLTESLNIQGEKLIILDEVIYFKTIRRTVGQNASNDKRSLRRHSLLNKMLFLQSRSGENF
jgi:hypothetical protein